MLPPSPPLTATTYPLPKGHEWLLIQRPDGATYLLLNEAGEPSPAGH